MVHQLCHALVFGGDDGDHRDAQQLFHAVDVDGAAVAPDLVHHVQGQDHGHVQLQQLHGQVEVALDVGGVHDVDDPCGMLVENELPGDDLLVGVGGEGIDAGQVGDQGLLVAPDAPALLVYGDAGEVAHMLVGPGELVEQGGFAAVLVAGQGEGQLSAGGQGRFVGFDVKLAPLAQAGVGQGVRREGRRFLLPQVVLGVGGHRDLFPVCQTEGEFIAVDAKLHGVPHGGEFDQGDLGPGDDAHIQEMLPQGAVAAHGGDDAGLPRPEVFQGSGHSASLPSGSRGTSLRMAQRSLAERARGFWAHSWAEGRMTSRATSA